MKRYFIVFYRANKEPSQVVNGYMNFTANGCYLNKKQTIMQINEKCEGLSQVVITNLKELNESDYVDWIK